MPLNCPMDFLEHDACRGCRFHHDGGCRSNLPILQKLSDILTIEERLSLLERQEPQEVVHRHIHYQSTKKVEKIGGSKQPF